MSPVGFDPTISAGALDRAANGTEKKSPNASAKRPSSGEIHIKCNKESIIKFEKRFSLHK
jgi:hypothetical protein